MAFQDANKNAMECLMKEKLRDAVAMSSQEGSRPALA